MAFIKKHLPTVTIAVAALSAFLTVIEADYPSKVVAACLVVLAAAQAGLGVLSGGGKRETPA